MERVLEADISILHSQQPRRDNPCVPMPHHATIVGPRTSVGLQVAQPHLEDSSVYRHTSARQTAQNQEPSFDGHNRHANLRYSWAVDLGPFKRVRVARQ